MTLSPVQCPKCGNPFQALPSWEACPTCGNVLQIEVFPALFRVTAPGQTGEIVMLEGESSCFYHPHKKAVAPCEGCGRFVCALCDCELNGRRFCPACLEAGKIKGKIKSLENYRVLYDTIALWLAIAPAITLIFWFTTIVTAPAALLIAIRFWNAPRSVVHRSKIRYVIAIILAVIQIAAWAIGIYFMRETLYV